MQRQEHSLTEPQLLNEQKPIDWHFVRYVLAEYWRYILGLGAAMAMVSTFWVQPRFMGTDYQAEAQLIPAAGDSLTSISGTRQNYKGFGVADRQDFFRTIAFLQSDSVFTAMVKQFELHKAYGNHTITDPKKQWKRTRTVYEDKVRLHKNRNANITIQVYDASAERAAAMANTLAQMAVAHTEALAARELGVMSARAAIDSLQHSYKQKADSAAALRIEYGVYNPMGLASAMSHTAKKLLGTDPEPIKAFCKLYRLEYASRYLNYLIARRNDELALRIAQLESKPKLTYISAYAVRNAEPARPNRILLVSLVTGFTVIFGVLLAIFLHYHFPHNTTP